MLFPNVVYCFFSNRYFMLGILLILKSPKATDLLFFPSMPWTASVFPCLGPYIIGCLDLNIGFHICPYYSSYRVLPHNSICWTLQPSAHLLFNIPTSKGCVFCIFNKVIDSLPSQPPRKPKVCNSHFLKGYDLELAHYHFCCHSIVKNLVIRAQLAAGEFRK